MKTELRLFLKLQFSTIFRLGLLTSPCLHSISSKLKFTELITFKPFMLIRTRLLKFIKIIFLFVFLQTLIINKAHASGYGLLIGPAGFGGGGTNPISGSLIDFEFQYVANKKNWELILAPVPGLFIAARSQISNRVNASLGAGIISSVNGVGIGPYASIGLNLWCPLMFCINIEYKQAIALRKGFFAPYALRLGFFLWLN